MTHNGLGHRSGYPSTLKRRGWTSPLKQPSLVKDRHSTGLLFKMFRTLQHSLQHLFSLRLKIELFERVGHIARGSQDRRGHLLQGNALI